MPKITYVAADAGERTVDVPVGTSVMRGAVSNGVPGIVAQCGGNAQCATCHVYVDPERYDGLPPMSEHEDAMLDTTACPRRETSRLSCQLKADADFEGLTVTTPERQR